MRLALCQFTIAWEDKPANLARLSRLVKEAASKGAALVLLPEMTLTGFSMNTKKTAEADGWSVKEFSRLAAEHKIAIGFGWAEAVGETARNHYTVVSPEGAVLSDYVKLHPFSFSGEEKYFVPGENLSSFTLGNINIATFICYDLRFPEVFQAASGQAHLLIVAANWPAVRKAHWRALLIARAIENQSYVAGVNCVGEIGGQTYSGNTMLVDPEGNVLHEIDGREGIIADDIDVGAVTRYRQAFPLKADRKTAFYKSIF
ncbi:MAG: carbon-nitrogen family hydrolase [Deltaproteobacteria bacterium]|nr:carbon-nitrogen family hydrolase [Deltaproteobacteria bacterium]